MKQLKRDALILPAVAGLVVLADQLSKYLVTTRLDVGQSWDIVPWLGPIFRITYVTNTGVAFGLFPGASIFFTFLSTVVAVAIFLYGWYLPREQWFFRLVLSLPLGGAIGNLVDRFRQGFPRIWGKGHVWAGPSSSSRAWRAGWDPDRPW